MFKKVVIRINYAISKSRLIVQVSDNQGFTLVELLVVISIIALLLSVLMPTLGKAREQARAVVCMSNQKQLFLATRMYTDQYRKYPCMATDSHPTYGVAGWDTFISEFVGNSGGAATINKSAFFVCPTDYSIKRPPTKRRTYGMNSWFGYATQTGTWLFTPYRSDAQIKNQKTVLFGDGTFAPVAGQYWWNWQIGQVPPSAPQYAIFSEPDSVHSGNAILTLVTGSIIRVPKKELQNTRPGWPPNLNTASIVWNPDMKP